MPWLAIGKKHSYSHGEIQLLRHAVEHKLLLFFRCDWLCGESLDEP